MYLSLSAKIYSQMLKASIKSMIFHHLPNRPVVIPIEIKKTSLFWETTSCSIGSWIQFLSLTLESKTSIFKTAKVLSNSSHAKTMRLWLQSWKQHPFRGTANPSIWFYGSKISAWHFFNVSLIWLTLHVSKSTTTSGTSWWSIAS